jgi:hypothetical protein
MHPDKYNQSIAGVTSIEKYSNSILWFKRICMLHNLYERIFMHFRDLTNSSKD